jgi:AcrR family transcriptional regulator
MPRANPPATTARKTAAAPTTAKPPDARAAKSELTRSKILVAAKALFVSKGLTGTTMEQIAEAAGVNKRMVYHHFGLRDDLFLTVLEDAYGALREAESDLHVELDPPLQGLQRLVAFTWDYYLAHPEFLALVNQENLHRAEHIKRSTRYNELASKLVAMIRGLLQRGVDAGVCRPGIDATHLWISMAALSWFYIANTHTISVTFKADMLSAEQKALRLAHMNEMILTYVRAG